MATPATPEAGWVDTHIHLLPGLDDGPATLEDALAMAEVAIADGITHAVATPHANYQFRFEPAAVAGRRQELQERLGERLRLYTGCELHLSFENVQAAVAEPRRFSLNRSRYLLVEFPEFFERRALGGALEQLLEAGAVPVLAHPERNPVLQQHPEALGEYLRLGCLSQVTASSFAGRFGKRAQQFGAELLKQEWVHIVASDGHSAQQRPPHFRRAFAYLEEQAGGERALALCRDNPLAMAEDRDLPYRPEPAQEKKKGLFARLRG
ncbi:MAG TPA: CpsB/CapC family capsule biosynthesis tyrosine phosphatase [Terriglobales bacterium]|nr:CpsB/CapC family capsule biosynthesis tyrosine phosphatase [Terriglobales bacterium]